MAEQFRIDIVVSGRQAATQVQQVERSLEQLNRTAASTNSLLRNALQIAGVASGVVALQRLRTKLVDLADTYTQIQNQLSFVTNGEKELASVTESLIDVSNRSRSSFEATAKLYSRTALASDQLGLSQQETLRVTETLNKQIILSGASAKEATNGLIQLSQAIASDRLGGDELRSTLEGLPVVADAIAKSLGVTRGQLRELGAQGVLTAKVITDALLNTSAKTDAAFAQTTTTVGQALQVLENNLIAFIGEANKASGATQKFAAVLTFAGRNIENLLFLGQGLLAVFAVRPLVQYAQSLGEAVRVQRAFAAEAAAGLAGPQAAAVALENEARAALLAAEAETAKTRAQIAGLQTAQATAVVTFQSTEAASALALANTRVAQSDVHRAQVAILSAEAEQTRALATGLSAENATVLSVVQDNLVKLDVQRLAATQVLARAEAELAAATLASSTAAGARAAASAQLGALDAQLAAQTDALAAAQLRLNTALKPVPTLLQRIVNFAKLNPYGVIAVGVATLVGTLVGMRDLVNTVTSGFSLLAEAGATVVTFLRELGESVPVVGGALNGLLKILLGVGAIVGAVFIGASAPLIALTLAVGGLALVLGTARQAFRAFGGAAREAAEEADTIAPIGAEILVVRDALAVATDQAEKFRSGFFGKGDAQTAALGRFEERIISLRTRLEELGEEAKRAQGTNDKGVILTAFERRNELLRAETAELAKSRREREIGLALIKEEESFLKATRKKFTPEQRDERRGLLEAKQDAVELAEILDQAVPPNEEFERLIALLDASNVQGDRFNRAMAILEQRNIEASPFGRSLQEIRRNINSLSLSVPELLERAGKAPTGDALRDLQLANKEREIQIQLAQEINAERARGTPDADLAPDSKRVKDLELAIRTNAVLEEQTSIREELLSLEKNQQFTISTVGLSDFERDALAAAQALDQFNDAGLATNTTLARNAQLAAEMSGILNNLQSPLLAQAQAQMQVADQIARANEFMAAGKLTAAEYALILQDLDFKARSASTAFSDGFTVALDQMSASINDATVGNQLLTSAVQAATSATSQFVQEGTVDFRKLALNIIDSIAQIITQLLILRAIKALAGLGGPSASIQADLQPGGSFVQGAFAEGGPVRGNRPALVGEEGPELFFPGRSGQIVPNDQVAEAFGRAPGGQQMVVPAPQVNVPVTVVNQTNPKEFEDFMASDAGGRLVVNQISRNPNAVRRGLGT